MWRARDAPDAFGYALSDSTRTQVLLRLRSGGAYPSDLAESIGVTWQPLSKSPELPAGMRASSGALIGFGPDSVIEVSSGAAVQTLLCT
jgi:hypothetical protein